MKIYNQDPDLTEGDTNQLIDEVRLLFSFYKLNKLINYF